MSTNKISVIVPCYFLDLSFILMTKKCLDTMGNVDEVIVVNDGSPLTTDMDTIRLEENGGYAKAVNAGLEKATGDILVICNNDIEFIQPDWLKHLIEPLEDYDISSIRTTDTDGWDTEDRLEENAKFGSIWAMKRDVYETLGGLDIRYGKGYFEDLDYRRRAMNVGFKIVKNHAGLVEHKGKVTFKAVDPDDKHYMNAKERYFERWGFME